MNQRIRNTEVKEMNDYSRYRTLLHLETLIDIISDDLEKGIAKDVDGKFRKQLDKIKREFLRLRREACEELDLIDSDDITFLQEYGPEMILIPEEEKITFADWFLRVMPHASLSFLYTQYSPFVMLSCETSGTGYPLDEGRSFSMLNAGGHFFIVYEGNDVENIVIKLIPHQIPGQYPEIELLIPIKVNICVADSEWKEQVLPKEDLELCLGDRFAVKGLIYLFIYK